MIDKSIISASLDQLEYGLAVCRVDDLSFVEVNQTMQDWFELASNPKTLNDILDESELARLNKATAKKRKYRFSKTVLIRGREHTVDFNSSVCGPTETDTYILIQGALNKSADEIKHLISEYDNMANEHKNCLSTPRKLPKIPTRLRVYF